MRSAQKKQYIIRGVEPQLDRRLRSRAEKSGKNFNKILLEILARGAGLTDKKQKFNDLDYLIGTWQDDAEFDKAIREQDQVDWKPIFGSPH